jgi:putative effector of murein hydrolase LrgA (UPF0299 family)
MAHGSGLDGVFSVGIVGAVVGVKLLLLMLLKIRIAKKYHVEKSSKKILWNWFG